MSNSTVNKPNKAFTTLLTKQTYLPGLLVLHHSLQRCKSKYPLLVMTTNDLSSDVLDMLKKDGLETYPVEWLEPTEKVHFDAHDARFYDTWTKLAAYGLEGYERVVLIDSDMLVVRNIDDLLEMPLEKDQIAAVHACTCNPRKLAHYPKEWIPENCAHTYAEKTQPITVAAESRPTFQSLNSGLVVLHPDAETYRKMMHVLATDPVCQTFRFPDQDFMAHFFRGRFVPLGYQYNALKTLRGCHKQMWSDDDVRNVHYILSPKPWQDRSFGNTEDEKVLHGWWWDAYDEVSQRYVGDALFEQTVVPFIGKTGSGH